MFMSHRKNAYVGMQPELKLKLAQQPRETAKLIFILCIDIDNCTNKNVGLKIEQIFWQQNVYFLWKTQLCCFCL